MQGEWPTRPWKPEFRPECYGLKHEEFVMENEIRADKVDSVCDQNCQEKNLIIYRCKQRQQNDRQLQPIHVLFLKFHHYILKPLTRCSYVINGSYCSLWRKHGIRIDFLESGIEMCLILIVLKVGNLV